MQNSKVKTSSYAQPSLKLRPASKASEDKQNYNPSEIESRWQAIWEKEKIYSPDLDKPFGKAQGKPFYNLMMFPYPSAEGMHVGNMYAFTGADVYGRFQRMQGKDVFEPIGLDGFGIHSENYAIKVGNHPVEQAKISEKNYYKQLHAIGNGFDWTRTVETYKPEYYKWTQWLFIQLFKAGLAYRKKAPVNFCPSCKTVLADEQVIEGKCERCETEIIKKELEQWFFAITKYADRLLANIDKLDWSEKVKIAQRQWIGRSEGTLIEFKIHPFEELRTKFKINVFTTRADTLYGATFLVLSPEHPLVGSLISFARRPLAKLREIKEYVERAKKKTEQERVAEGKEKTGVFSGIYAINPVNKEKIPIWIADYAIMGYGTGALFGDAHDERDVEFAKKYKIPLKATIITGEKDKDKRIKNLEECFTGYGVLIESGPFSGLTSKEAMKKVSYCLEKNGVGGLETTYHLRDWLISRQRYWGPPIPMVFCEKCSWQPVPEEALPVELPFIEDYKPLGTGKAPLASHPEFYKTKCPNCGGEAKRETDVSDNFLDNSWYFLRYLATEFDDVPFPIASSVILNSFQDLGSSGPKMLKQVQHDIGERKRWLPVAMYIGGAEHSVLHLLYSRFITMALNDLGFINFEEPFTKFRAHGLIVKDGAKMSKSKGNVVIPDEYIKKFGADTLRTYLMFMGPFSQGGDFRDSGIEGMFRFLNRVWRLLSEAKISADKKQRISADDQRESFQMMHKTIKKVTEDISDLSYNTAIAAIMEWYNYLNQKSKIKNQKLTREELEAFVKLLAPFAPHVSEELWSRLSVFGSQSSESGRSVISQSGKLITDKLGAENRQQKTENWSIHNSSWPTFDSKFLVKDELIIVIQVNGKLRGNLVVDVATSKNKAKIEELAKKDSRVQSHLEGKSIKKVIYVEGKVVNFVTA